MSYARPGEGSDVYVVRSDGLICSGGFHGNGFMFTVKTEAEMIEHLHRHIDAGDAVPESALLRLIIERDGWRYETDVERVLGELKDEA